LTPCSVYNDIVDRFQPHRLLAKTARHRLRTGALLCALVVLFSLVAKVSWYHAPAAPTPSIAKLKAFKAELPTAAPQLPASVPATTLPALFALFALFLAMTPFRESNVRRPMRVREGFLRTAAARPPPVR
jgi:hypothetical protein